MWQVEIFGKEQMNGFFQGRLINRKVGFLDTIEKNNLQTGIKSKKKKKRQKVIFF